MLKQMPVWLTMDMESTDAQSTDTHQHQCMACQSIPPRSNTRKPFISPPFKRLSMDIPDTLTTTTSLNTKPGEHHTQSRTPLRSLTLNKLTLPLTPLPVQDTHTSQSHTNMMMVSTTTRLMKDSTSTKMRDTTTTTTTSQNTPDLSTTQSSRTEFQSSPQRSSTPVLLTSKKWPRLVATDTDTPMMMDTTTTITKQSQPHHFSPSI